jgi:hypothetical protein
MSNTCQRLSETETRFIFYGGSFFADEIISAIQGRDALLLELIEMIKDLPDSQPMIDKINSMMKV